MGKGKAHKLQVYDMLVNKTGLMEQVEKGSLASLRLAQLKIELEDSQPDREKDETNKAKVDSADQLIGQIDLQQLAAFFGVNQDEEFMSDEERLKLKDNKEVKKILTDTLKVKLEALIALKADAADVMELERLCAQWVDKKEDAWSKINTYLAESSDRLGTLLKAQCAEMKPAGDKQDAKTAPAKAKANEVKKVLEKLGWKHLAGRYSTEMLLDFPEELRPF